MKNVTKAIEVVSIIIPVYNVKPYIAETIDSVLSQTYKNFELILVDDGSTDGSGEVCDSYALKDGRVRTFHKENSGSSDSRNLGLDMAKGSYILFIDADDYIMHNMLEKMLSLMESSIDIVSCGYTSVSRFSLENYRTNYGNGEVRLFTPEEALADMMYQRSITNTPWAKLYRTCLFDDIRFPSGKINQDLGTIYKVIGKSRAVRLIDLKMYMYMYRPDSVINSRFAPKRMAGLEFAKQQHEYIKENFPSIVEAAVDRLFMESVFIVRHMRFIDTVNYKKEYRQFRNTIVSTRGVILADTEVRFQHKVSAASSYIGVWPIVLSGYLIRTIQRALRIKNRLIHK